jgi:hypothetical protein
VVAALSGKNLLAILGPAGVVELQDSYNFILDDGRPVAVGQKGDPGGETANSRATAEVTSFFRFDNPQLLTSPANLPAIRT